MVDRDSGVDQAFMVCRTEESKLQAFEESLSGSPSASVVATAAHRNMLNEPPDRSPPASYEPTREAAMVAVARAEGRWRRP
jgi:hypothetical protein